MAKLPILSAEQIAAALDLAEVEMEIPEWGTSLKLKAFTIDERDKVLAACTEKNNVIDAKKLIRLLVVHGVVEPKLTLEIVSGKSFAVVEAIAKKVMELNGMQSEKGASPATVADVTFRQES
jgi:uncharacterized protein YrrD